MINLSNKEIERCYNIICTNKFFSLFNINIFCYDTLSQNHPKFLLLNPSSLKNVIHQDVNEDLLFQIIYFKFSNCAEFYSIHPILESVRK